MLPKIWRLPVFAVGFLGGIAGLCLLPIKIGLCLIVAIVLIAFGRWKSTVLVFIGLGLLVAALRFAYSDSKIARLLEYEGKEEVVEVLVMRVERPDDRRQRLSVAIDGHALSQTQVEVPIYPSHQEGETLSIRCLWEVFGEEQRIIRGRYAKGLYLRCQPQELTVVSAQIACRRAPFLCGRQVIVSRIAKLWPRPVRSLVVGLLLGDKADFPKETLQQFSRAGISHIIALSGFNITVIIVSLEAVALRLAMRKNHRAAFVAISIGVFTIFVGGASSIVRAACMGVMAVIGKTLGRKTSAGRLLLISALLMTLANPFTLLYDAGFQLSCLATYGLLAFSEWIEARLLWLPDQFSLRGSLSTTLAASLPTLPLLAFTFGSLSFVSPLTNILVLPLIPHIMWSSALSVVISPILPGFAQIIATGVSSACSYILAVSAWAASLPFAAQQTQVSPLIFVLSTAAILAWGWYIQRQDYA